MAPFFRKENYNEQGDFLYDQDINRFRGYLLVLFAAVFWGTTGTAQAFAPVGADPLTLGFFRIVCGGSFLLVLDLPKNGFRTLKGPWPFKTLLGAATGMGFYQIFFFAALLRTGVAVGTMITMGSAPIVAGLWGYLLFRERLTKRWIMATSLAIAGCVLLSLPSADLTVDLPGVFLALCAGICWATAGSFMKKLPPSRSPLEKTAIMLLAGSLIISPLVFSRDFSWVFSAKGASVVIYLGIFATALPYSSFAKGILSVPVATAYTLTLAEPVTASILGIFLLEENLTLMYFSGMVLIFAGLTILSFRNKKAIRPTAEL